MKTLLLIDANSLIHRAYYALPPLTTPEGEPIGAIYGLSSMLLKILREQKPDYIAAAHDTPEPTFREGLFKEYKAQRPKIDKALVGQLLRAHELFEKFGIPSIEKSGFEADDIIAALVKKFKGEKNLKIVILTGDLDALQLVEKNKVVVKMPKKGVSETVTYNETKVKERYGLKPKQLPDYKGLVGDPSDNIPGVPGVGPKTASKILREYKTLEALYKKLKPKDKLGEKLLENKEQVLFSKKLAQLQPDIPLEVSLKDLSFGKRGVEEIVKYFTKLGFQSLIRRSLSLFAETKKGPEPERWVAPPKTDTLIITNLDDALEKSELLQTDKIKIAFDWKELLKELASRKITVAPPLFDLKIAGWLLDPDQKDFSVRALSERFLKKSFTEINRQLLTELYHFLNYKIKEYELEKVMNEIEMPLLPVLAKMEEWGVGVNIKTLKSLRTEIEKELEELAKKIYEETGVIFNINSYRQLANVLEKLKIKPKGVKGVRKEVLQDLKNEHPVIDLIIKYRENFKINSGFVKPLIESAKRGRVRTTFVQTGTSTGRLASERPNLQNLPHESKWSKELRMAFEPEKSSSFIAFDYSQLELRILAHLSGDKNLCRAFQEDIDAHKVTASQVFNVSLEEVTESMRRLGKTLNFGVIYGMGPRALSSLSGLPLEKAEQFIRKYFEDFSGVREWQNQIKAEARTFGFVKNENGRRRWFLGRSDEVERAAVNFPIQSLGADILKLAMTQSCRVLEEKKLLGPKVKLVNTIHDELLFEVGDDILENVSALLKGVIEKAYKLSVPLKVDVKTGKNLADV